MSALQGNAIVGQSGGPTAAINATLSGVIRGVMQNPDIRTLYGARHGIDGMLAGELVTLSDLFDHEDKLRLLEQTPAAALGSCRRKLPNPIESPEVYETLFSMFRQLDIRYFFYIGGNDSMDTVLKLNAYAKTIEYEIRIIGVPKTIDNDVVDTDHTPGFGSAAKYIAVSMQEILRDCAVYTVPAVTIVEIMGRDAGWLTASAALTGRICGVCPDAIYLPERPFKWESFFADLRNALSQHHNVVIATSEGIRFEDGNYVGASFQSGARDVFGHQYLAGTGKTLEHAVRTEFGCKTRSVELNILQRCAAHMLSSTDIAESIAVGSAAVRHAISGESGRMMGFVRNAGESYRIQMISNDIAEIANRIRSLPDAFINAEGNGVTPACLDYLFPLIQGEYPIKCHEGLPIHFVL